MLGWSIEIKRGEECLLYAVSTDISLDSQIRENAVEVLDSAYYPEWGYGYPNRYRIRNDQLPQVALYRWVKKTEEVDRPRFERENLELGSFPDVPGGEILWVELWDQS